MPTVGGVRSINSDIHLLEALSNATERDNRGVYTYIYDEEIRHEHNNSYSNEWFHYLCN